MSLRRSKAAEAEHSWIRLPEPGRHPALQIARRVAYGLAILTTVALIVLLDNDGYHDNQGGHPDLVDSFYYASVTLSTTGYGDIVPVSNGARLTNVFIITPLRIAFLAILVGTTFQVLTRSYWDQLRRDHWRTNLRGHTVVIGYGTKGFTAIEQLKASGVTAEQLVVIDHRQEQVDEANRDGYGAILGDATRSAVLRQAAVDTAERVIIATNRDDTAVLATLTVRQLNPSCVVVTSIREAENEPLLLRSGADAVVTSSEAAGRLLGVASRSPVMGEVFTDLLVHGDGLELVERAVEPGEIGRSPGESADPIIAVLREGRAVPYGEISKLVASDRVVVVGCKPRIPAEPDAGG